MHALLLAVLSTDKLHLHVSDQQTWCAGSQPAAQEPWHQSDRWSSTSASGQLHRPEQQIQVQQAADG